MKKYAIILPHYFPEAILRKWLRTIDEPEFFKILKHTVNIPKGIGLFLHLIHWITFKKYQKLKAAEVDLNNLSQYDYIINFSALTLQNDVKFNFDGPFDSFLPNLLSGIISNRSHSCLKKNGEIIQSVKFNPLQAFNSILMALDSSRLWFNESPSKEASKSIELPNTKYSKSNYLFVLWVSYLLRKIHYKIFNKEQWHILIASNPSFKKEFPSSIVNPIMLQPPKDRFWADPILHTYQDKAYLFIEELEYKKTKAHLSVVAIEDIPNKTQNTPFQTILESEHHLSFPYIFEDQGEVYLIPENAKSHTIPLYKAIDYPYQWAPLNPLMNNIQAADVVIEKIDHIYYMFLSLKKHSFDSFNNNLHIYYSDDLYGPWHAHPKNPIKTDVKSSRMAGPLIQKNDHYYRCAQDCSFFYGKSFNFYRIEKISPTDYVETYAQNQFSQTLIRETNFKGTHTFSSSAEHWVVDLLKDERK